MPGREDDRRQRIAVGGADHHQVDLLQQAACDYAGVVRSILRQEDGELVCLDLYCDIIRAQAAQDAFGNGALCLFAAQLAKADFVLSEVVDLQEHKGTRLVVLDVTEDEAPDVFCQPLAIVEAGDRVDVIQCAIALRPLRPLCQCPVAGADAVGQHGQQVVRGLQGAVEDRPCFYVFDGQQLAIGGGNDVGGNLVVVEHGHLAYTFADAKQRERLGVICVKLRAQPTGEDDIDAVVMLPRREQGLTRRQLELRGVHQQRRKRAALHILEQRRLLQQLDDFF